MTYTVQKNKINDKWMDVLVVATEEQQEFENPVVQTEANSETRYYTKSLYKMVEGGGVYYYWFILDHTDRTVTDTAKLAEYEEALRTLGVEV